MNQKIGRNDPCPCGSGKKYKSCCQAKAASGSGSSLKNRKLTAKWLNAPAGPDLIERTFGQAIASTGSVFKASNTDVYEKKSEAVQTPEEDNKE